ALEPAVRKRIALLDIALLVALQHGPVLGARRLHAERLGLLLLLHFLVFLRRLVRGRRRGVLRERNGGKAHRRGDQQGERSLTRIHERSSCPVSSIETASARMTLR